MRFFAIVAVAFAVLPVTFSMPLLKRHDTSLGGKEQKSEREIPSLSFTGDVTNSGGGVNCQSALIILNSNSKFGCKSGPAVQSASPFLNDPSNPPINGMYDPTESAAGGSALGDGTTQLGNVNPFSFLSGLGGPQSGNGQPSLLPQLSQLFTATPGVPNLQMKETKKDESPSA